MKRSDLIAIEGLTPTDVAEILALTREVKANPKKYAQALAGKQVVLMFEKPSLRTRLTFEVGIRSMGGNTTFVNQRGERIEGREALSDIAHNLERWLDAIVLRTYEHSTIAGMAEFARIPVVNGLSDREHPCQALADYFTIQEHLGDLRKVKLAYVGDGYNVTHSLILTAAATGSHIAVATPKGFEPENDIVAAAQKMAAQTGAKIEIMVDPKMAVQGANVVYTDIWASMGKEAEELSRRKAFRPYQVNAALMKLAAPNALFMHCLPAHRGEEVTDEVIDSAQSVVFDEAENRMHVQKAIMLQLLGD